MKSNQINAAAKIKIDELSRFISQVFFNETIIPLKL